MAQTGERRTVVLDGGALSCAEVEAVSRGGASVEIAAAGADRVGAARALLEGVLGDGLPHYGINTGFGSFARRRIPDSDVRALQRNLIRSHAAGVGPSLPTEVVRGMMLLLAASLCRGCSGVRLGTVETLVGMLNARGGGGVVPVVPETGSCGASGDLAPLAHCVLVMIGEGEATVDGKVLAGAEAMGSAGLLPVELDAKEGLALIDGTHLMAAQGALLVRDFERLFGAAVAACAMSIDGCRATHGFLDARVHGVRRQPGQERVAAALRALLQGSEVPASHRENDPRVQDPYSLRCAPQVLGAAWDAFEYVRPCVDRELGAVTDNPLIFEGTAGKDRAAADIVSAGNFHGMALALPLDALAVAVCHVAGIAERRVYHMLSGFDAEAGLPPFLAPRPGLHSGLMIAQYTAAACCNELIGLATPASVANLSTSAGMEDYNSWGPRSAAKARRGVSLARSVVAIELISAAEALEYHRPLRSGAGVERAHDAVRSVVPRLTEDRPPAPDIAAVESLIAAGVFGET